LKKLVIAAENRPTGADARAGRLLIRVHADAVCRTDLHIVEGNSHSLNCRLFRAMKSALLQLFMNL
jgi:D-arabinose 1-dehydrogenase-like Zn-dependent alcohol dehydrogenase